MINLPDVPNLDAYITLAMAWLKDFVGQNVIFCGGLVWVLRWVDQKSGVPVFGRVIDWVQVKVLKKKVPGKLPGTQP